MAAQPIAYCGLDCRQCPVYIATRDNDDDARQRVAAEWTPIAMQHWASEPLKVSDMNCGGCKSGDVFAGVPTCPMRKCCSGKGLEHCGQCDGLDGCGMITGFLQENPEALPNLHPAQ